MKDKTQTLIFKAVVLYLFCYFTLIFDFPHILTLIFGAILCAAMLVTQKKFRLDVGVCLLTVSMVLHFTIMYGTSGLFSMITYVPIVIYVVAHYAGCSIKGQRDTEGKFLLLIFMLVFGHTIHGSINAGLYITGHFTTVRKWLDIWTQQIVAGTQQVVYFLPALAVLFPACVYWKKRKAVNTIWILATILFCYISLRSKSRISIVILAIIFCAQILLYLILERKNLDKILSNKRLWIALGSIFVVLSITAYLIKDTAVVRAFIENLSKDGGILNNVRFVAQREALSQLYDYPWGGRQMTLSLNYLHNVWLDMANATGSVAFTAFAAYTFLTIYELIRFLMKKTFSTETKLIVAGIYGAFFLYFTVEPALDASIHYLTPWFFMNGLVHSSLTKEEK